VIEFPAEYGTEAEVPRIGRSSRSTNLNLTYDWATLQAVAACEDGPLPDEVREVG